MSQHQPPRYDENPSIGGSTGLDHAGTGTCPYHTAVMLAPGESCPICSQKEPIAPSHSQRFDRRRHPLPSNLSSSSVIATVMKARNVATPFAVRVYLTKQAGDNN